MKPLFGAALAALIVATGCSEDLRRTLVPAHAPEILLTREALPGEGVARYRATWTATDPDGDLDHCVWAVDPLNPDRVDASWTSTRATERILTFAAAPRAATEGSARPEPHVFVVRAVDRRGAMSEPAWVALAEDNTPPSVQIVTPRPSTLLVALLPPSPTIVWEGIDPDGIATNQPVRYVYRLFPATDPDFTVWITNPDSLRRKYAPDFEGWTSVDPETTSATYTNLTVGMHYLFVVTGFDEAGDYDPIFSLSKNMLLFTVKLPNMLGPQLTFFNQVFNYTWPVGWSKSPPLVRLDIGAGVPMTLNWSATPGRGLDLAGYRWVLDPAVLDDETPRSGPDDTGYWSEWSLDATTVTLGPFPTSAKNQIHRLYVEARDNLGSKSIGGVELTIIQGLFYRPLLIVDDTRLAPDRFMSDGTLYAPTGPWPMAAEADTFLYARGGFPWRGYPAGTLSSAGIFDGFEFDTLGTRTGRLDLSVPLEILARYRHVIWLTDLTGATFGGDGWDPLDPKTSLRFMSEPGRVNTLGLYASMGGHVWLAGGGAAAASLLPYNYGGNDGGGYRFSSPSELGPGRLMYEFAAWRSEIRTPRVPATVYRFTGRFGDSAATTGPGSPYAGLPPFMRAKSVATDPLPPLRNATAFYQNQFDLEFLSLPNPLTDGDPPLDTLFSAAGATLPSPSANPFNVTMTIARGTPAPFIFTGFNLWNFRRADCVALVDFMLEDQWGLMRNPPAARANRLASPERAEISPAMLPAHAPGSASGQERHDGQGLRVRRGLAARGR